MSCFAPRHGTVASSLTVRVKFALPALTPTMFYPSFNLRPSILTLLACWLPIFGLSAGETRVPSVGQLAISSKMEPRDITLDAYLNLVVASSLDYAARKYNVSISEAAVMASKVFPNPVFQAGNLIDSSNSGSQRLPSMWNYSLTQTFEPGGKRRWRQMVARQNLAASAATLESFMQNLKMDAAGVFAEALAFSSLAKEKQRLTGIMQKLLTAQQRREKAGDVGELEVIQTRVEVGELEAEAMGAEADAADAALALNSYLGPSYQNTRLRPQGSLTATADSVEFPHLMCSAIKNRADLAALRLSRDSATSGISLAKANRVPNVDLGFGFAHSTNSNNIISPQPSYNMAGFVLSMPLPLWNRNKAEITTAQATAEQAQVLLEAAELKAGVDVRRALAQYNAAKRQLALFQDGVIKDAEAALDKRGIAYQRGQSTLLELLDARRTAAGVWEKYLSAQSDQVKAVIELHRSAGIWHVRF